MSWDLERERSEIQRIKAELTTKLADEQVSPLTAALAMGEVLALLLASAPKSVPPTIIVTLRRTLVAMINADLQPMIDELIAQRERVKP